MFTNVPIYSLGKEWGTFMKKIMTIIQLNCNCETDGQIYKQNAKRLTYAKGSTYTEGLTYAESSTLNWGIALLSQ